MQNYQLMSKEELIKELERIKNGIKTNDTCMIIDGGDMTDHGWMTQLQHNKQMNMLFYANE